MTSSSTYTKTSHIIDEEIRESSHQFTPSSKYPSDSISQNRSTFLNNLRLDSQKPSGRSDETNEESSPFIRNFPVPSKLRETNETKDGLNQRSLETITNLVDKQIESKTNNNYMTSGSKKFESSIDNNYTTSGTNKFESTTDNNYMTSGTKKFESTTANNNYMTAGSKKLAQEVLKNATSKYVTSEDVNFSGLTGARAVRVQDIADGVVGKPVEFDSK